MGLSWVLIASVPDLCILFTLKLSTVSTVTIDDGSWFHCMIDSAGINEYLYRRLRLSEYVCSSLD